MRDFLLKKFENVFGYSNNAEIFFAPGRVNLIGEHTDYNGGYVFPCAVTFGTYAIARKRKDSTVKIYSENYRDLGVIQFNISSINYVKEHEWANYPKGVICYLEKQNYKISSGVEILFYGNIPSGSGLSSSASIELVTAVALKNLFDFNLDLINMIQICKAAENNFIGVNCGIMDQFAICMSKKGHAILLDTNSLKYEYVKLELAGVSILITNTNKQRGLFDSKYNERRSQCEAALRDLQVRLNINSLGELDEEEFEKNKHLINDPINIKRARHAVYENRRTLRAVQALRQNDIKGFGQLMNESHMSLKDDYEVTGEELDTLVGLAWKQEGVIGSRMTGAGFGGCTVSIVKNEYVDHFINDIGRNYFEIMGLKASFYVAQTDDGARKLIG